MFCNVGPLLYDGLLVKRFLSFVFFFFFWLSNKLLIGTIIRNLNSFEKRERTIAHRDTSINVISHSRFSLSSNFFRSIPSYVIEITDYSQYDVKKVSLHIAIIYSQYSSEFNSCIFGQSCVMKQLAYIDARMEVSTYYAYAIVKDSKRREKNRQWWNIMEEYIHRLKERQRPRGPLVCT